MRWSDFQCTWERKPEHVLLGAMEAHKTSPLARVWLVLRGHTVRQGDTIQDLGLGGPRLPSGLTCGFSFPQGTGIGHKGHISALRN